MPTAHARWKRSGLSELCRAGGSGPTASRANVPRPAVAPARTPQYGPLPLPTALWHRRRKPGAWQFWCQGGVHAPPLFQTGGSAHIVSQTLSFSEPSPRPYYFVDHLSGRYEWSTLVDVNTLTPLDAFGHDVVSALADGLRDAEAALTAPAALALASCGEPADPAVYVHVGAKSETAGRAAVQTVRAASGEGAWGTAGDALEVFVDVLRKFIASGPRSPGNV